MRRGEKHYHQINGARRGVGSVLTYRVFPGSKAGEIPGATGNRISRNPTERRAPKPAGVISSRSLPCPESQGVAAVRGSPFRRHRRSGLIVKLETYRRSNGYFHLLMILILNDGKSSLHFIFSISRKFNRWLPWAENDYDSIGSFLG